MIKLQLFLVVSLFFNSLMANAAIESLLPATPPKNEKKAAAAGYDVKQFWRDTGLEVDTMSYGIATHCYDSAVFFQACADALNVLSMSLIQPEYVGTDADKARLPELGGVARDLGGGLKSYYLVQQKFDVKAALTKRARAQAEQARANREAHSKAFEALYAQTELRVNFADLISAYKIRLLVGDQKKNEAIFAAYFFNAFMGVARDPHTYIMTVAEVEARSKATEVEYVGIGVEQRLVENGLRITKLVEGGNAISSGLHFGDIVTHVDGKSVVEMLEANEAAKLSGVAGSATTLTVLRGNDKKEFTIVRKVIVTPVVESRIVSELGIPYGYVRLANFLEADGVERIRGAIEALKSQGAKGFIFDLRGNGGGDLQQAISISSFFVGRKIVLGFYDFAKQFKSYEFGDQEAITELPMVTLIDGSSASASELVSGALQSHQRGWILGDRSFGKGTVQSTGSRYFDQAGKIYLFSTIGRFYQPSGTTNQLQGIIPDFYVDPFPGATEDDKFVMREEDQFRNAVTQDGALWQQPRPEAVERINRCRAKRGQADRFYRKNSVNVVNAPDYRVLVAQDVLNCEVAK